MDPIVHFEIPVDDMAKARKFYGDIFGWELADWPMPDGSVFVGAVTTPVDEKTRVPLKPGAINGGFMQRSAVSKTPAVTVHVASIDKTIEKVKKGGGSVIRPKLDLGMGFIADVADAEGNRIGLWEDAPKK